jgi:hypothetical protein
MFLNLAFGQVVEKNYGKDWIKCLCASVVVKDGICFIKQDIVFIINEM